QSYASLQLELPRRRSLIAIRDELSAGQAKLLGYLVERCRDGSEVAQHQIETDFGHAHPSSELYYRLELLIVQGFLSKRRIATFGQFDYRLTEDFRAQLREV